MATDTVKRPNILVQMKDLFGYPTLKEFSFDWKLLDEQSKSDLRTGVEDGSMTYPDRNASISGD
jgi:hypothetical protein